MQELVRCIQLLIWAQQTVKQLVYTENNRNMELKHDEAMQMLTADRQCCKIKMCSLRITWENSVQVITFKACWFYTLVDMLFKYRCSICTLV